MIENDSFKSFVINNFGSSEEIPFETITKKFKKKSILVRQGDVANYIYYLKSGVTQTSIELPSGEEKIFVFYFPNQMFSVISSLIKKTPSDFTLSCVTNCEIELIRYDDFFTHLASSKLVLNIYRHFIEQNFIIRLNKEKDLFMKSPREMYMELVADYPELLQLLPLKKVANYLGVHPLSLSRIRSSIG